MAIQTTDKPLRPRDRNIDARMKILGVLGFLLLAVAFFSIGVFLIGPRWGSFRQNAKPPDAASAFTPTQGRRLPAGEETKDKGPDIKLEVTEDGVDAPAADEPAHSEPAQGGNDIQADGKDLTITLDGKEKQSTNGAPDSNAADAVERSTSTASPPKNSGGAKPVTGSSLEKPRAATEQHSTAAAPGRE